MVVLAPPEAVVDEEQRARLQDLGERRGELRTREVDLGQVTRHPPAACESRPPARREAIWRPATAKPPAHVTPRSRQVPSSFTTRCTGSASSTSLASTSPRQRVGSSDSQATRAQQMRRRRRRCVRAAAPAGPRSPRESRSAPAARPALRGRAASSAASLPLPAPSSSIEPLGRGDDLGRLPREGAREKRRDLRRGDEVPRRAELLGPGAVVTQSGRVERKLHVAREGDPPARRFDLVADRRDQLLAVRAGERRRLRAAMLSGAPRQSPLPARYFDRIRGRGATSCGCP